MKTILAIVMALCLVPPAARAEDPVEITWQAAKEVVNDAKISKSAEKSLKRSLTAAWELYGDNGKDSIDKALKKLAQAKKFVNAGKNGIPKKERGKLVKALADFVKTLEGKPPGGMAILHIRARQDLANGPPLVGADVRVDGVARGTTAKDGTATVLVRPGTRALEVRKYPSVLGRVSVGVKANQVKDLNVAAVDGKDFSESADLNLDQAPDGVLDGAFSELRLRMTRPNGATVSLKDVDLVFLLDPAGGASVNLTAMTARDPDGTIRFTDPDTIRPLLAARTGKISINVHAEDSQGRTYDETVEFFMGVYQVQGKLVAPPSDATLDVSDIEMTGRILNTNLVFTAESDAGGNFTFPLLPAGNLEFESETKSGGIFYYGQGIVVLNGNKKLTVKMLAAEDMVNGVTPFTVEPLVLPAPVAAPPPAPVQGDEEADPADARAREQENAALPALAGRAAPFPPQPAGEASVTATATAAGQNVPVTQTKQLTVEKGVKTVQLSYTVASAEYPTYVLAQSTYNDTWSIVVRAGTGGEQLTSISRQINTQLSVEPLWQSTGSTGVVKQTFDITKFTKDGTADITLFVSATNVGDSALATSVNATLGADPGVKINKLTADTSVPQNCHSIPLPGELNEADRHFTLDITKPAGTKVKKVTATLFSGTSQTVVVDSAPGADGVTLVDEKTVKVRVSIKKTSVKITNPDPPFHLFKIRFKLQVEVNGTMVSDEKETGDRRALWRMPTGFDRYSTRDAGGDDWASKGTYKWLNDNKTLITKINDISGEHGKDIGHKTHQYGTDIDMFHFHKFSGAASGGDNHTKLQEAVLLAASKDKGAPAAKTAVVSWITASRTGIDNITAKTQVTELRYLKGDAVKGTSTVPRLRANWGEDLLTKGKIEIDGKEFIFVDTTWSNSKFVSVNDHNDHVHITLGRPALGE